MFWQFQPSGTVCFMFLGWWCKIFARFIVKTNSVLKTEMVGTILSKKNKVVDNSFIHFKKQAIIQWTISPKAAIYTWNHLMKNLGIKSNHHCHDHHCHHWHFVRSSEWNNFCGVNILRNCLWKQKNKTHQHQHWYSWKKYLKGGPSLVHEDQVQWSQDDWWHCPRGSWGCRLASSPPVSQQRGPKREASVGESGLIQSVLRWFSKKNWFKQHPNWKMRVGFKRNLNWKMVLCGTQHFKKMSAGTSKVMSDVINCEILFRCS